MGELRKNKKKMNLGKKNSHLPLRVVAILISVQITIFCLSSILSLSWECWFSQDLIWFLKFYLQGRENLPIQKKRSYLDGLHKVVFFHE